MKKLCSFVICLGLLILTGCKEEQQKPEAKGVNTNIALETSNLLYTNASQSKNDKLNMTVHHHVKNHQVFVECIVTPNFHFTQKNKTKKYGEGQLHVFLNGRKIDVITQGAFIIRDIPKGKHEITLKLLHNDLSEYGISETFIIEV